MDGSPQIFWKNHKNFGCFLLLPLRVIACIEGAPTRVGLMR